MQKIILNLTQFIPILLFGLTIQAAQKFEQPCRAIGDDYLQFKIEIAENNLAVGSEFNLKITAFEDEKCQIPYISFNQYFKINRLVDQKINLQVQKVTYAPLTAETTDSLNMIGYCNSKDWKNQQEIDVTGEKCNDFQQLASDELFFQIVHLDPNGLLFGETSSRFDGHSENNRPEQFEALVYQLMK